jgi:UDP-3-O-[3-hydroxymyristoyl] glucosamine N-acyltransferase
MIRCSFLAWVITGSVAVAADGNQDGCQDEYAANGACVDVDATVDASTTVGANALVFTGASVGPEVALGADVVLGARASLAGRVAHTSNPLPIGAGTVIGRSAQLGVDHSIGGDVTIGRAALAGARLTIAAGGSLGYAAQVGDDVNIGAGAVVGNLVTLGDFATLGDNAVVARSVTIADGINSGDGASVNGIVGPDVLIAAGSRIEQGARVRKQAHIRAGAAIEANGRVGRGAVIGEGATVFGRVGANATVGAGATVEDGSKVASGGEVCAEATLPTGSQVAGDGTWPVEGCLISSTCQTIKTSAPSSADGMYSIDPDGLGGFDAFDAYCDMTRDSGGWTLVMQNNRSVTDPTPTWVPSTTQNTVAGTMDALGNFDVIVGLANWQHIGTEARYEMGSSAGNPQNQARYASLTLEGSTYALTLSGQTITVGSATPGLFSYHNGRNWTTADQDNDSYSANCSSTYNYRPWWYGSCWSGSLWGHNSSDGAYWISSSGGGQNWGALWIR